MAENFPISKRAFRWIEVLLAERFGYEWNLLKIGESLLHLQLVGEEGVVVFDLLQNDFFKARSDLPYTEWNAKSEGWDTVLGEKLPAPGVTVLPSPLIDSYPKKHVIHYDIFGLVYWAMSRIEEIGCTELDNHKRFAATSSHAFKYGYLERPIIDEWLHILGQVIQRTWPLLKLKHHKFRVDVSHDVDRPSLYAFKSWRMIARIMAKNILNKSDVKDSVFAPYIKLTTRKKLHSADPFNTFDWLMDMSDANGLKSSFYFICGRTDFLYDADYELSHHAIRDLMSRIHQRGHMLGLHPSYNTFQNPDLIISEASPKC